MSKVLTRINVGVIIMSRNLTTVSSRMTTKGGELNEP